MRPTKTTLGKLLATTAAGLLTLSLTPITAHARQAPDYAPLMLVLDASGSMKQADSGGRTKMDSARTAAHTFVDSAPAEARVGLTVYGTGTGSTDAEKTAGCQDVQVLRPADTIDKTALNSAVDGIQPRGYTPIGTSLRKAADALPKTGPRSIVLVSDGEDTCAPPDPCEVARELIKQGTGILVHTIGFGVDEKSRKQLTCVAQVTGGTYSDAPDGKSLERILPRVSTAALRNYEPAGTPITGTAAHDTAPVAAPGQHLDTIGRHETRYYAVDVPQGATTYFSGTVSFPRPAGVSQIDDMNTLNLRVHGEGGRDCNSGESELATMSSDGVALTVSKTWTGATQEKNGSGSDPCKGGGTYYFAATWDKVSSGVPERLPIELLVGVEPAVSDPGPVAVLPGTTFVEPAGASVPATGGGSFNVAATLNGGGRYTDLLQRGEYVFYRVKLDWGQGLAYRVSFGAAGSTSQVDNISNIATTLYTPFRKEISTKTNAYTGSAVTLPSDSASEKAITTVPVRYDNRTADATGTRAQSVAGWYYLAVKLGATAQEGANVPVPVSLDLTVTKAEGAGPTYATANVGGVFGERPALGEAPITTPVAETTSTSSNGPILLAAAGAVVVLAAVGAFLVIRRRGARR
jgi:Ca-activated chloride channel family protein